MAEFYSPCLQKIKEFIGPSDNEVKQISEWLQNKGIFEIFSNPKKVSCHGNHKTLTFFKGS